jgi:5'-deoxynucleotidase YfbR-like HD superfamily hydrolase
MISAFDRQIAFVLEIDKLKGVLRQTLLTDGSRRENSAEHSWHLAIMASLLAQYAAESIDTNKVIRMVLVHDLVEIDAGDTFAYDVVGNQDKEERELRAADRIFGLLPPEQGAEFRTLWEEFEAAATPEAQFANALDRLQPLLNNWRTRGGTWRMHRVSKSKVYQRMEPVRRYLPVAWPLVQSIIEESRAAGWIEAD